MWPIKLVFWRLSSISQKRTESSTSSSTSTCDAVRTRCWRVDIHHSAGGPGPYAHFVNDPSAPEVKSADAYGKALFDSQSFEEWSKLEDLTLAAIFFVTSAFLGLLAASVKGGMENATASVINITSGVTHFDLSHGLVSWSALFTPLSA